MHGDYGSNPQLIPKKSVDEFVLKTMAAAVAGIYQKGSIHQNNTKSLQIFLCSKLVGQ